MRLKMLSVKCGPCWPGLNALSPFYYKFHELRSPSASGQCLYSIYPQISNIRHNLLGNEYVDHSGVFGASPVGAVPTTSSFLTKHLASMDWAKTR